MTFSEQLQQIYWGNSLKTYLVFFAILVIGFFFRKLISKLFGKLLFILFRKYGKEVRGEKFVELLLAPIEWFLLVWVTYIALNQLEYPLYEKIFERGTITYFMVIDKIFVFMVIFTVVWILLRIIDFMGLVFMHRASLTDSKTDDQLVPFVRELIKFLTVVIGFFVTLGVVFELDIAAIVAGLGIGGLAIALAGKETVENLFASFTIFADKPFVVGDLVRADGIEGVVEKVGFRSTRLRTLDKSIISVPNKNMIDGPLDNLSLRTYRRLKFTVGLTYDTPAEKLRVICEEVTDFINAHPKTSDTDNLVIFEEFADSSLNLMVLYFVEMMSYNEYMQIRQEINYKIMEVVKKHAAEFAFPTRTLHMVNEEKEVTKED